MPNAAIPGQGPLLAHPESAPEATLKLDEASETGLPASTRGKPLALPRPVQSLRQALTHPIDSGCAPERPVNFHDPAEEHRELSAAPNSIASKPSGPEENSELHASRLSGRLAALAETAKTYARAAQADNTQRAYAADWRHFASWLRRQGLAETPPDPEAVGLYLASQVERRGAELSVATLERRLSGIAWRYRQLGQPLEIRDRHIATVLAGIRRRHGRPPLQKAAIFTDELLRCWRLWRWTYGACATGRFWRSASPAVSAAPKSSASIAGPARPRTALAGSKLSPRARS
jgi:hypothetical protein